MKVLFWVDAFPTYSETFIRDQIVSLLDQGIDVEIFPKTNKVNNEEQDALIGFESYNLLHKVNNIDSYFRDNKIERLFRFLLILFLSIFSENFKFYKASLDFYKFGVLSKSLRLFFRVHFILKNDIKIIHAHFGPNGIDAAVFKTLGLPIKLFTTFHGYDIRLGLQKGGNIYNNLFNEADGIFAISEYNYKNLLNFGVSKSKLISLSNGINISFFKRITSLSKSGVIKLLTVARLVDEKALDIAIKAIYKVLQTRPDIILEYTIVGEGELRSELEDLIKMYKLSENIKLLGSKNSMEVRDLMIQSDLFLLPSQAEASPTVLLEAQACEMVVLATDVGSVKDIVKSGLVVSSKDVNAFKNGLVQLIEKRDYWNSLAKEGLEFVKEFYDMKKCTKKLIKSYK